MRREPVAVLLRQLESFVKVAESGSFNRAARQLFITPTAVMKQINELEGDLGVCLLRRGSRGVNLTDAGSVLLDESRRLLGTRDSLVRRVRAVGGAVRTTVRIGSSPIHPVGSLKPYLGMLGQSNPELEFDVVHFDESGDASAVLSTMGREGPFDCIAGVCASEVRLKAHRFLKLDDIALRLAVPMHHRLASAREIDLADLSNERVVLVRAGDSTEIDDIHEMLRDGAFGTEVIETPLFFYNCHVFSDVAKEGMILLTTDVWAELHPGLITLPVHWDKTVPYGLLYPSDPDEGVCGFVEALVQAMGTGGRVFP